MKKLQTLVLILAPSYFIVRLLTGLIFERIMSKPKHYDNGANYDVIDIANDYNLSFARGNAVKYIVRAGVKKQDTEIEDLEKAITCLEREINYLEKKKLCV